MPSAFQFRREEERALPSNFLLYAYIEREKKERELCHVHSSSMQLGRESCPLAPLLFYREGESALPSASLCLRGGMSPAHRREGSLAPCLALLESLALLEGGGEPCPLSSASGGRREPCSLASSSRQRESALPSAFLLYAAE